MSAQFKRGDLVLANGRAGVILDRLFSATGITYLVQFVDGSKQQHCWTSLTKIEDDEVETVPNLKG